MEKQIVVFELGKEQFGIEISCVEGIIKMQEITSIPFAPPYMDGITSLRGAVLPVMNLARKFGVDMGEHTKENRIVVIIQQNQKVGMIVSAVSEVLTIDDSIVEPPPPMVSNINAEFVSGIAKINERLIILLDLDQVLK